MAGYRQIARTNDCQKLPHRADTNKKTFER